MDSLIVIENPKNWRLLIPGAEVVAARDYLTDGRFSERKRIRVYNLCRTYGYQTVGYYVSLLATARGHRPLPSVATIQDLRQSALTRIASGELEQLIEKSLADLRSSRFELSIYFGRNTAKRYDKLSGALFHQFAAPLLRAEFVNDDGWRLDSLRPIAPKDIPDDHHDFVVERACRYFERPLPAHARGRDFRYELAILFDAKEENSPSGEGAIDAFVKAARNLNMNAYVINKDEYGKIAEYDGLFIRETTAVNHHTYRFARRAAMEGLVVIDDPESIIRCTNKVYLAEVFIRHGIEAPKTMIVHPGNMAEIEKVIGFPCVVKRPDSSFSTGVKKAANHHELATLLEDFLEESELAVVQAFTPSDFDWRITVLNHEPLFACKYYMAKGHWQIQRNDVRGNGRYGKVQAVSIRDVPPKALELATRATSLIGDGLYGVDLKELAGGFSVIEINDNPNIDSGMEDKILGDALYTRIMRYFFDRLEDRGRRG